MEEDITKFKLLLASSALALVAGTGMSSAASLTLYCSAQENWCRLVATLGDFQTTLPARGVEQGSAIIAIRPSRLVIGAAEGFTAVVNKATYVGSRMEYSLESSFAKMFAVQDDVDNPLTLGQEVTVGLAKTGPILLPVG